MDIVEAVRRGLAQFEHETACGLIAVDSLSVERGVLVKLCEEIEALREERDWMFKRVAEHMHDDHYHRTKEMLPMEMFEERIKVQFAARKFL
jgi:hypothetical protein